MLRTIPFAYRAVLFIRSLRNNHQVSIRQRLCSARASSHGARIQTSRSSSVVRITGIALGWIGSTIAFGDVVKEAAAIDHDETISTASGQRSDVGTKTSRFGRLKFPRGWLRGGSSPLWSRFASKVEVH